MRMLFLCLKDSLFAICVNLVGLGNATQLCLSFGGKQFLSSTFSYKARLSAGWSWPQPANVFVR